MATTATYIECDAICRSVYKEKLAKYVEDPAFKQCVGWKSIPELVNGRLSMLGTIPTAVLFSCYN